MEGEEEAKDHHHEHRAVPRIGADFDGGVLCCVFRWWQKVVLLAPAELVGVAVSSADARIRGAAEPENHSHIYKGTTREIATTEFASAADLHAGARAHSEG